MFITYNTSTGKLLGISDTETESNSQNKSVEVTGDVIDTVQSILTGKVNLRDYIVDISSSKLKIVKKQKNSSTTVVGLGQWVKILKKTSFSKPDILLTVRAIDNKLFLEISHNLDNDYVSNMPNTGMNFYFTRLNDLNFLYQHFYCNFDMFNSERKLLMPVTGVDPDLIFSHRFSIYYTKLVNNVYYEVM